MDSAEASTQVMWATVAASAVLAGQGHPYAALGVVVAILLLALIGAGFTALLDAAQVRAR